MIGDSLTPSDTTSACVRRAFILNSLSHLRLRLRIIGTRLLWLLGRRHVDKGYARLP